MSLFQNVTHVRACTRNSAIAPCSQRRRSERRFERSRACMRASSHAISHPPETRQERSTRENGHRPSRRRSEAARAASCVRSTARAAFPRDLDSRSAPEPKGRQPRDAIRWVPPKALRRPLPCSAATSRALQHRPLAGRSTQSTCPTREAASAVPLLLSPLHVHRSRRSGVRRRSSIGL